jgi:gliding motility-associated peptidyl-prolyl isomerase
MKYNKIITSLLVLVVLISSCKQSQEARKPISRASGTFMKKSAERNKKLVAGEESLIQNVIKKNAKIKFIASTKGYWYSYSLKNNQDTLTAKKGDVAFFDYEIKDLKGNLIYSKQELGPQIYYVDKQNIMMGLRDGIKLMHKKEKVNFLFTSHMGYGYHGDEKKIGTNMPLLCIVTLRDFKSEAAYKKENELKMAPTSTKEVITETKPKDSLTP